MLEIQAWFDNNVSTLAICALTLVTMALSLWTMDRRFAGYARRAETARDEAEDFADGVRPTQKEIAPPAHEDLQGDVWDDGPLSMRPAAISTTYRVSER